MSQCSPLEWAAHFYYCKINILNTSMSKHFDLFPKSLILLDTNDYLTIHCNSPPN